MDDSNTPMDIVHDRTISESERGGSQESVGVVPHTESQDSELMDVNDPVLDATLHGQIHGPTPNPVQSVGESELAEPKSVESLDEDKIDEDDDSRAEGTIKFTLPDVRKLTEVGTLSPHVMVRNLPWKIMVMKRKSRIQHEEAFTLGFFLQCNAEAESTSWTCTAQAKLKIIPYKSEVTTVERGIQHMFYNKENDWGFTNFIPMDDLLDTTRGFSAPDYSLQLEVNLTADPPHGVCWDSKKYTGYIGLKNQGATCYMNSLLQALYFTNKLRKAVYLIPTEADDAVRSVPLAIQRVFYELQTSDKPVGTKKLTKSFGWETLDSFMQHDAQELCRVLLDNIDMKMKATRVEGTIPNLFEGKMVSFIRCTHVDYESSREESFMDIQLNVKDRKDVYESFDDYIAVEVLDGDNKYDAGDHGLQEAEKGIAFLSFPPVLHLQLKRFQFDPMSESNIKINDRFEFPERLDLTKYVKDPRGQSLVYFLHAVLVHSGDNHGGHYVVYINPKGDGKWCKFDDDVVTKCHKKEAIERNYGGASDEYMQFRNCANAYMLVYIAESMRDELLQPVAESDIPGYLSARFGEERETEMRRRREKSEQSLYLNLRVVTEDDLVMHQGHDLVDFERIMTRKPYRVRKDTSLAQFGNILADWLGHHPDNLKYWPWQTRQNGSLRPTQLSAEPSQLANHTVQELSSEWPCGGDEDDLIIFLEILPFRKQTSAQNEGKGGEDMMVLFFRLYDPVRRVLEYKGFDFYQPKMSQKELLEACNQKAGFPSGTPLLVMNDIKQNSLERVLGPDNTMGFGRTISQGPIEITDMDLLIFQKVLSPDETERLSLPTVKEYFKDLTFRTEVEFIDKDKPNDETAAFTITLNLRMGYHQVVLAVASRLGTDPKRIQLFRSASNAVRDTVGSAVCFANSSDVTLKDLVASRNAGNKSKRLYYQQLEMDIAELESRKEIKLVWQPNFREEGREITVLVNKGCTVRELVEQAKKQIEPTPDGTGEYRLVELSGCRVKEIVQPNSPIDSIASLSGNRHFRIEEIPADQLHIEPDEMLMPVAHMQKEHHVCFGIPFYLKIKTGELVGDIKERIRKIIDVPEKEFEKYKFCFCYLGKATYFEDSDKRINLKDLFPHATNFSAVTNGNLTSFLGIDHVNRTPKRPRPNYLEKAVRIYN